MLSSMIKALCVSPEAAADGSRAARRWRATLAAALLAVGLTQTASTAVTDPTAGTPRVTRALVAVLPFATGQSGEDWALIAASIGRHVIENLSRLPGTLVMAPESTEQWQASGQEPVEFSRALGAKYVLVGTVAPADERIHVGAALLDTTNGAKIWSADYVESRGDLALAAQTVARSANVALLDEAAKRSFYRHFNDPTS